MITVTGTILDANGVASCVRITIKSLSTPLSLASGEMVANTTLVEFSSAADGTFSVDLEPGDYSVDYAAGNTTTSTSFKIRVPDDDGETYNVSEIVLTGVNVTYPVAGPSILCPDDGHTYQISVRVVNGVPTTVLTQVA